MVVFFCQLPSKVPRLLESHIFCDAAVMTADIGVRMHEPGVCNGIARYCEYLSCLSVPLLVVPNKPTWANGMELHAVLRALWVVLYMDGQTRFSAP